MLGYFAIIYISNLNLFFVLRLLIFTFIIVQKLEIQCPVLVKKAIWFDYYQL